MKHYLEIKAVEKVGVTYYELWLHTGTGAEFWIGSHSHTRIEGIADHVAVIEAPSGIDKMKIIDSSILQASVPLVESFAKMNNGR